MPTTVFGLEITDEMAADWQTTAHLVVGELREDDAIDFKYLHESGSFRYLATANTKGAKDTTGIIEAPPGFDRLAAYTREVLETNVPIVRRPTVFYDGFALSVLPVIGKRKRVAVILEPAPAS